MTEPTRRDVALGDLSAVDSTSTGLPALSATAGATTTRLPAVSGVDGAGGGKRPPGAAPVGLPPALVARLPLLLASLGALVVALLVMVILLLVAQRDLQRALAALQAEANESVASLADRVTSTSTNLKSTDSETQKSLNLLAADIGKVDSAQARLGKTLDQLARQHGATAAELRTLAGEVQRAHLAQTQADSQRDARSKAQAEAQDALAARLKTLADNLARLERSGDAAQLRAEVAVLGAGVRDLQDQLERRLKAADQATASNDAFRRQVNATIDRLNQQVSELYQRR